MGQVENVCWNLVEYSEQFNHASWSKAISGAATVTITPNATTAPNGTTTADLINLHRGGTSEISCLFRGTYTPVGTYKGSIWLKAKDASNVGKTIDIWSWEGATRGYTKVTLTADWVRHEQDTTVFTGSGQELFDFGLLPISFSTSTTLDVEFYAWGAQSNIGSTAKPYFPTTDRLNVPRLTYENGCPSLLLEKQSTNVVTYREDFTNASWVTDGLTVSSNSAVSPDGTQNADKLVSNNASGNKFVYQVDSVASGTAYTLSAYFKSRYSFFFIFFNHGRGN